MIDIEAAVAALAEGDRDTITRTRTALYEAFDQLAHAAYRSASEVPGTVLGEYLSAQFQDFQLAAETFGGHDPQWRVTFATGRRVRVSAETEDAARVAASGRSRSLWGRLTGALAPEIASVVQVG